MRYIYMMRGRLLFLIGFYLGVAVPLVAQVNTSQISLTDSTLNILYVGFPNKVVIANLPAGATVKFGDEYVTPTGNIYILDPTRPGNYALTVYNKDSKTIFTKEYTAGLLDFRVRIGKAKYEVASVSDILARPALELLPPDCKLKPVWRIASYDITLVIKDVAETRSVAARDLTGVPFDKKIRDKIARMHNGDRIFVENIKAYGPDETMRTLASISLTIAFDTSALAQSKNGAEMLRNELRVIVDGMAASKTLRGKGAGWLEKLQEVATDSELIALTDSKNTVVRNYALLALTARNYAGMFPIVLKHLRDTSSIAIQSDVSITWRANEYLVLNVQPTGGKSAGYRLTPSEEVTVDSTLLFDSTLQFGMKDLVLRYMKPDPKYYDRIRTIASSGKEPVTVLILARFKRKGDVDIINKSLDDKRTEYYGVCAAREFPEPSFYPALKKMFEKKLATTDPYPYFKDCEVLLEALAKYPSEETYRLFEKVTLQDSSYKYERLQYLLQVAITKFPDPIFEPLKNKIKVSESYLYGLKEDVERETW